MAKFSYGAGEPVDVTEENEAQYEAAGWSRIDDVSEEVDEKSTKKSDKTDAK
jgi:hypothetical protein